MVRSCKNEQQSLFHNWLYFTIIMSFICIPILVALDYDIDEINFNLKIYLAPLTLSWVLLIYVLVRIIRKVFLYRSQLTEFEKFD